MSDVKIRLRFYLPHDMDLISLMITHEMDIVHAMYCSVKSFVRKESFAIKIPPLRNVPMEKKRVFHRNLSLDSKRDQDILDLLECIEPGYRNNFLKNILRLYLFYPGTEAFLTNPEDMPKLETYYEVFRKDKRVADAAFVYPKKIKTPLKKTVVVLEKEMDREVINKTYADFEMPNVEMKDTAEEKVKEFVEEKTEDRTVPDSTDEDITALFTGLLG